MDKVSCLIGVLFDVYDVLEGWICWLVVCQEKVGKVYDCCQNVVEVMGNFVGQLIDGLYFLVLGELSFQSLLLGCF